MNKDSIFEIFKLQGTLIGKLVSPGCPKVAPLWNSSLFCRGGNLILVKISSTVFAFENSVLHFSHDIRFMSDIDMETTRI